ncbi:MAG: homocitrate synthase [Candidatus Sumerlaeota bacterium]|nr:homocitrate synthase [Candidatus Sumerlaeota bacterium]
MLQALSNHIGPYALVDSTLREGEQFAGARFTTSHKIKIAQMLDAVGVEYIELSSPASSAVTLEDHKILMELKLKAKLVPHLRCAKSDIDLALETGVKVFHLMFATSSILQKYSHGKTIDEVIARATEMVRYLKDMNMEVRFSGEDAFRSDLRDLERVFAAVLDAGADRVGLPDTVGGATPFQVYDVVRHFRTMFPKAEIEFHAHNDAGCAVANSFAALMGGATHLDVTILGIGERNGITPLTSMIARLYSINRECVSKYNLKALKPLDEYVAKLVGVDIPFTACITSPTAFHHRAGIHTNAMIRSADSYEIFHPEDFGMQRTIDVAHRLVGKNAIKQRAQTLGLDLPDAVLAEVTWEIKTMSDQEKLTPQYVDDLLRDAARGDRKPVASYEQEGSTRPLESEKKSKSKKRED